MIFYTRTLELYTHTLNLSLSCILNPLQPYSVSFASPSDNGLKFYNSMRLYRRMLHLIQLFNLLDIHKNIHWTLLCIAKRLLLLYRMKYEIKNYHCILYLCLTFIAKILNFLSKGNLYSVSPISSVYNIEDA